MDGRTRRDVGVASATGGAIVVATLAVGTLFPPADPVVVRSVGGGVDGAPIAVADADETVGGARGAAGTRRPTSPRGPGTTGRVPSPDDPDGARGRASGPTEGGPAPPAASRGGGTRGGSAADGSDRTPAAPDGVDPPGGAAPAVGEDGASATTAVRLRVTDLGVTGTDSGILRAGSEVRVRLGTERETRTAPPPLPERLDVRIRLDDDALATLATSAEGTSGPLALRALVDLVDAGVASPYTVRVRMQLVPGVVACVEVHDAPPASGGASNVVAVTTPVGVADVADEGSLAGPGPDGSDVPGPRVGPVEVRVPLPVGDGSTTPQSGASVAVPIPADATAPAGEDPATAGAAVVVHVPADDEPLGGTPEALGRTAQATPEPGAASVPEAADGAEDPGPPARP